MDAVDESGRVLICSACSGHGFKFGPVVGAVMADLAETGTSTRLGDMHRFRLSRLLRQREPPRAKL